MEEDTKKRFFLALNLPPEIKHKITGIINKLSRNSFGIKWVNPAGLHITLHFLGDVYPDEERELIRTLGESQNEFGQVEFELNEINAFPNINQPRVIVLSGRQLNSDSVFKLHQKLKELLGKAKINFDYKPFKIHVTLGRVKRDDYKLELPKSLNITPLKFSLASYELMKSELTPAGASYSEAASFKI